MSERVRILLVDDDKNVRTVVSARLRGSGYDVIQADDGASAIERVREGGIAVVVLDVTMPEMDGFEVLARLQKLENRPSVLFLTAVVQNDTRIKALYGGAVDYIDKAFEPGEFLARIAVAVRQYGLLQGALEEARTDELTGMKNRRSYDLSLAAEFTRAVRYQRSLALILIDVDGLKQINDTDGHAAGDAAIIAVANTLMRVPRGTDRPARIGGDEFAVVLPEANRQVATEFIARLREALSETGIGVSIGFALFPDHALDEAGLRRVADERLYNEKAAKKGAALSTHAAELIPNMIEDMNMVCRSIEEAAAKNDLKTIEFLGHQIKGTSSVFGFHTLSDLGGALEISAQSDNGDETRNLVEKLARHLEELITSPDGRN